MNIFIIVIMLIFVVHFIRNAVGRAVAEKQKDFMYKMSNVPYATDEEEREIMSALFKLSDEDLQVSRVEKIEL